MQGWIGLSVLRREAINQEEWKAFVSHQELDSEKVLAFDNLEKFLNEHPIVVDENLVVYLICCKLENHIHQLVFEIENIYKCTNNTFVNNFAFRKTNGFSSKSFYACSKGEMLSFYFLSVSFAYFQGI